MPSALESFASVDPVRGITELLAVAEKLVVHSSRLTDVANLEPWRSGFRNMWTGVLRSPTPEWAHYYVSQTVGQVSHGAEWVMNGLPATEARLVEEFYQIFHQLGGDYFFRILDPAHEIAPELERYLRQWQDARGVDRSNLLDKDPHPPRLPPDDDSTASVERFMASAREVASAITVHMDTYEPTSDGRSFAENFADLVTRVGREPTVEWAAYTAATMSRSISGALSWRFGGGSDELSAQLTALHRERELITRDYPMQWYSLDDQWRAWQVARGIVSVQRDVHPPREDDADERA